MYSYKIGISAQEHDDFVTAHPQANLLQSSAWAQIKDNWGNERLGFYKDGHLIAAASVLIKPLPLGMTMLYIPRGPIMDYSDKELLTFVLASLKKFAKEKKRSLSSLTLASFWQKARWAANCKTKPRRLS